MAAILIKHKNPLNLSIDKQVITGIQTKIDLYSLLRIECADLSNSPYVVYYNGKITLRRFWKGILIAEGDLINVQVLLAGQAKPGKKGQKDFGVLLTIVAVVAIAAAAFFTGGLAIGLVIGAGITGVVGAALIGDALSLPTSNVDPNDKRSSPNFDVSAYGNKARLGEVIPIMYGRHRQFPDYFQQPFTTFVSDLAELNLYYMFGHGEVIPEEFKFGETSLSKIDPNFNFSDLPEVISERDGERVVSRSYTSNSGAIRSFSYNYNKQKTIEQSYTSNALNNFKLGNDKGSSPIIYPVINQKFPYIEGNHFTISTAFTLLPTGITVNDSSYYIMQENNTTYSYRVRGIVSHAISEIRTLYKSETTLRTLIGRGVNYFNITHDGSNLWLLLVTPLITGNVIDYYHEKLHLLKLNTTDYATTINASESILNIIMPINALRDGIAIKDGILFILNWEYTLFQGDPNYYYVRRIPLSSLTSNSGISIRDAVTHLNGFLVTKNIHNANGQITCCKRLIGMNSTGMYFISPRAGNFYQVSKYRLPLDSFFTKNNNPPITIDTYNQNNFPKAIELLLESPTGLNHNINIRFQITINNLFNGLSIIKTTDLSLNSRTTSHLRRKINISLVNIALPITAGATNDFFNIDARVYYTTGDNSNNDNRYTRNFIISGINIILPQKNVYYSKLTWCSIKIRAGDYLSQNSLGKFNTVAARRLKRWDVNNNSWLPSNRATNVSDTTGANSIPWTIADILSNTEYGLRIKLNQIDFSNLIQFDNNNPASNSNAFNYVFDRDISGWEALQIVARCAKAALIYNGSKFQLIKDEPTTNNPVTLLPSAMYSDNNILKDSFDITYNLNTADSNDGVEVEYVDNRKWLPRKIIKHWNNDDNNVFNPLSVQLDGCTNEAQARSIGLFLARTKKFRRRSISFKTELDAHISTFWDVVSISHSMPNWTMNGFVINFDPDKNYLYLSNEIEFEDNKEYIMSVRAIDGNIIQGLVIKVDNEINAVKIPSKNITEVNADLFTIDNRKFNIGVNKERAHYSIGEQSFNEELAKIISVKPSKDGEILVTAINDDIRVYK